MGTTRLKIIFLILLIFLGGCSNTKLEGDNVNHKTVEITTEDGIRLAGDLYEGGEKGIILLHMYTMTKKSWENFALELKNKGYSVLAIDFRGHGASDLNYNDFSEKDFNNMIYDVKAAKKYLNKDEVIVMGASIGANIALKFANEVEGVVALSPSFNYKGIKTIEDAKSINKPTLVIVSEEDKQSVNDSRELNKLIKGSYLQVYSGKGHGTRMLDQEIKELIFKWLDENF